MDDKTALTRELNTEARKISFALRDIGYFPINISISPTTKRMTLEARHWYDNDDKLLDQILPPEQQL